MEMNAGGFVTVRREDSDQGSWIVRRWAGNASKHRSVFSEWFADKQEALACARRLQREHGSCDLILETRK